MQTTDQSEMSGARKWLFVATAFLVNVFLYGENGTMPIINNIYEQFGPGFFTDYIVSASPLWLAIGAAFSGRMMQRVTKKRLLVLGAAIFAAASNLCVRVMDVTYVAVMRSLMGFGAGIINTVMFAYIAQLYVDEDRRASFTGYFNAAGFVIGAVISYVAGMFAVPDWTHAFLVYLPTIAVIIAVALFIPELGMGEEPSVGEENDSLAATSKNEALGTLFIPFVADYIIYCLMYSVIAYFISIYVVEASIGDAALAGALISVSTLAGFVTSAVFGKLYAMLAKRVAALCLVVSALSILAMYLFHSSVVAYVSVFLVGAAYGAYYSYSYVYVAEIVPPSRIDDAISYTTASFAVLYFVVPFIASFLTSSVTGGSYLTLYLYAAVLGFIAVAVEFATDGAYKRLRAASQD